MVKIPDPEGRSIQRMVGKFQSEGNRRSSRDRVATTPEDNHLGMERHRRVAPPGARAQASSEEQGRVFFDSLFPLFFRTLAFQPFPLFFASFRLCLQCKSDRNPSECHDATMGKIRGMEKISRRAKKLNQLTHFVHMYYD